MSSVIVLCIMFGVIDSRPPEKLKGFQFILPDQGVPQTTEGEREAVESIKGAVGLAQDVIHTYNEFEFIFYSESVYDVLDEFRENQDIVDYLEFLIMSWKIVYRHSAVLDEYLQIVRGMRCTFWQIEARVLLNWARELKPDSLTAVGRVESIRRNTDFSIEELGSDDVEFLLLQKISVRQMQEAVAKGLK